MMDRIEMLAAQLLVPVNADPVPPGTYNVKVSCIETEDNITTIIFEIVEEER